MASGFSPALQTQPAAPTFRTEANYVRVDVFPTANDAPVGDLRQDDFEVLEDHVPQKIEQFEHVVVRGSVPQEIRREPNTLAESRQAVADARARVFVLFLDVYHVEVEGSHNIRKPLVEALDRIIGEDDLVAVMTPEMSARDVTFARRTTTINGMLERYWAWGERNSLITRDREDDAYRACYPGFGPDPLPGGCKDDDRGVADQMIDRRHEKLTLDALEDLVRYVRGLREERKAILAITDGWLLYRPDARLARQLYCRAPAAPAVGIDPRTGRILKDGDLASNPAYKCDGDRLRLAQIDDDQQFRETLDEANRANVSFYPIDPRGLAVFDEPIVKPGAGVLAPAPPSVDQARLRTRIESLRRLAEGTDGLAIVNSNDLSAGLRRVVADLTSYYLLGYYSTGKLDGKFHSITVRVKRPGVRVRARRGYLAARAEQVAAANPASTEGLKTVAYNGAAAAVARLAAATRDQTLRVHVVAGWLPASDGKPTAAFWTVGEVADRIPGSDLDVAVSAARGEIVGTARGRVTPGATSALVRVTPGQDVVPGEYVVRLRSQSPAGSDVVSVPVSLPPSPDASGAVFIRRGPVTGNKDVPTADLRFRRSERLRVEVPFGGQTAAARLLDRTGKPMAVPVVSNTRQDADGSRWATAELVVAPLGAGDYVIEMTEPGTAQSGRFIAFRVIP